MSEWCDAGGNSIEAINRPSPEQAGGGLLKRKRLQKAETSSSGRFGRALISGVEDYLHAGNLFRVSFPLLKCSYTLEGTVRSGRRRSP
jgi:hypothetical protein